MKDNISPEERLLRLIKQGTKKSSHTASTSLSKTEKQIFVSNLFKVSYLNNLLLFFLFLSLVILAINFILPKEPAEIKFTSAASRPQDTEDKELLPKMKPYDYYAQQIGKRDLFAPSIGKKEEVASGAKSSTLREMVQDFSLIGIMEGQNPQAIIEDKKAKKTYFLNRGDYLGEIKINDIQAGKVTLEYEGESVDLFL
jgi:hypothetical protein